MKYTSNMPAKRFQKVVFAGALGLSLCLYAVLAAGCARADDDIPVYEATTQRLHDGSLYYATSGCLDCHGTAWNGKAQATPPELKIGYFAAVNRPAGVQLHQKASLKSEKRGIIPNGTRLDFPVSRAKSYATVDGIRGKWLRIRDTKRCPEKFDPKKHKSPDDKKRDKSETCWLFSGHLKIAVVDFTLMNNRDKTPLDYFKTITAGSRFNKTLKDKKIKSHDYQELTDRARWAMANFLFSLAPQPQGRDAAVRAQALSAASKKAADAYEKAAKQGHRRWQVGFTPIGQRPKSPTLDDLLKKGGKPVVEAAVIPAPTGRIQRVAATGGRGAAIYQSNCASCHGKYAAGEARGARFGLAKCKGVADNAKESRQCPSFFAATDLKGKASAGRFKATHRGAANQVLSGYYNLTDGELATIFAYINKVAK